MNLTNPDDHDSDSEPLGDLAQRIGGDEGDEEPNEWFEDQADGVQQETDDASELFEQQDVDEVEDLWERIEGSVGSMSGKDTSSSDRETMVPKQDYCAGCPHLSDPVEMRCTHENTEILELVDVEHVRVHNCPVVEEQDSFEELQ